jgi:hypothetical protein
LKSCLVFGVWLWHIILTLQIFPLLVNITDLYIGIRTKNYEYVWFDSMYATVVVAYGIKLIFYDKIFNNFIFDAKSVEGFTNQERYNQQRYKITTNKDYNQQRYYYQNLFLYIHLHSFLLFKLKTNFFFLL